MIETLLSALALLVAIGSAIAAWRLAKRQTVIQERMLAFESKRDAERELTQNKAQLRAAVQEARQHKYVLVIINEGAAQARHMDLLIDGVPAHETDQLIGAKEQTRILGPGASTKYYLAVYMGSQTNWDVKLSWLDDSGELGHWHSQLSI